MKSHSQVLDDLSGKNDKIQNYFPLNQFCIKLIKTGLIIKKIILFLTGNLNFYLKGLDFSQEIIITLTIINSIISMSYFFLEVLILVMLLQHIDLLL